MNARMATTSETTIKRVLESINFDAHGLVPAIAQQHDTGEVLMMAWMDHEAVSETLRTGQSCYWSRSRQALWRKGETSGQIQSVVEFLFDCDSDTILLRVDQTGVACHTGRRSCFFNAVHGDEIVEVSEVVTNPAELYPGSMP